MEEFLRAKALIEKAQKVFIFLPEDYMKPGPEATRANDIFCAGTALSCAIKNLGKEAELLINDVPKRFMALGRPEQNCNEFAITINSAGKDISEMRYEKNGNDFKILFALKGGNIEENDISFNKQVSYSSLEEQKPDLLVTIGSRNLEGLGKPFNLNPDLFYQVPVLNIDNDPLNEGSGQVNLLETVSLSVSEIVTKLIGEIGENLFDQKTANCLLAGVVSSSFGFKHPKTRPQAFDIASYLIERGADYQSVLKLLSSQKTISQVRLLGQALKSLEFNEDKNLYTAALSENDFYKTSSQPKDLAQVIEELRANLGFTSSLLLLWESHASPPAVRGVFYSSNSSLALRVAEGLGGQRKGEGVLFLLKENNLEAAKKQIVSIL